MIIGNSSSGILEAPYFKTFSINIGDRQKGRLKPKTVIDNNFNFKKLIKSFNAILLKKKMKKIQSNFYLKGSPSQKIINILKKVNLNLYNKKIFYEKKKI